MGSVLGAVGAHLVAGERAAAPLAGVKAFTAAVLGGSTKGVRLRYLSGSATNLVRQPSEQK